MRLKFKIILLFVLFIIATPISSGFYIKEHSSKSFSDGILYVGGSGPNNYSTIQGAIDPVVLIGENKSTTIIDGGNSGDVVTIEVDGVTIEFFTIQYCGGTWSTSGIHVLSDDNFINSNILINDRNAIYLESANYNNNVIKNNNANGIYLWESSNNVIEKNEISNNQHNGIVIGDFCNDNLIFHNNFINNLLGNAYEESENIWDNGYPAGGNYWDDYQGIDEFSGPNQDQPGSDGIGDSSYSFPEFNNKDNYPFMDPYSENPPSIIINKPKNNYFYFFNIQLLPFITTFIIGKIDIEVTVDGGIYGIKNVEFYIDDILEFNDSLKPYTFTWSKLSFEKHTIKIIAYDRDYNLDEEELQVFKLF